MGEIVPVTFGPDSKLARSKDVADSRIINAFVEPEDQGKVKYAIYSDPGLLNFAVIVDGGGIRAFHNLNGVLYAVSGERVFKVTSTPTITEVGQIPGTATLISAQNRKAPNNQVAFATGTVVYILENDVVTEVIDADLPDTVHSVAFLDGYFIYGLDDGRFFLSAIDDGFSIAALDFAEAEGHPDGGVRLLVFRREMWYFGTETIEIWKNVGASPFPFQRLDGAFMSVGIIGKHTPVLLDNSVFWVTNQGYVARDERYTARRVSTFPVDQDIQRTINAGNSNSLEAIGKLDSGHSFYELSGPDFTWSYDAATQLWHRKESTGVTGRSRQRNYIRAYNKHIVGDYVSTPIYEQTFEAEDEATNALIWSIKSNVVHAYPKVLKFNALHVDMQAGVGNANGNAHNFDPQLMLRWSDDGGNTWSLERTTSLGQQSDFSKRISFTRLGKSTVHGRIFELRCSAPVTRTFLQAYADVELLNIGA